jgi:hypothetical protein
MNWIENIHIFYFASLGVVLQIEGSSFWGTSWAARTSRSWKWKTLLKGLYSVRTTLLFLAELPVFNILYLILLEKSFVQAQYMADFSDFVLLDAIESAVIVLYGNTRRDRYIKTMCLIKNHD